MIKKIHHCWWIMISCCLIMACGLGLLFNCAGIFLVPVSETLGVGRGPLSFYLTIMNIVITLTLPLAGKILSKHHIGHVLTICYAVNYALFASLAFANSIIHFYVVGVIMGFCSAFSMIMPVPIIINSWFKKKLGVVMGLVLAFSGIGGVVFNLIGSLVIEHYSWRIGYLTLAALGSLLVLPCTIFIVRSKPEDMGLRAYGAEENEAITPNSTEQEMVPKVSFGIVFKVLPIFAAFAFTCAITLAGALQNHIPAYSISLGYSSPIGGMAVSVVMAGIIACKIGIGYLHDRFGVVVAVLTGITAGTIGAALLVFGGLGIGVLFAGAFLFGIIPALTVVAPPLFVKKIAKSAEYNYILSYVNMGNTFFCAIGISIYGFIFDLTKSYAACFVIIFIMIAISYFTCLLTAYNGKDLGKVSHNC